MNTYGLHTSDFNPQHRERIDRVSVMNHDFSNSLYREVRPDFFRVLSGQLARLYVDALDALECESTLRPTGMERDEVLAVIEQVIEHHAELANTPGEPLAAISSAREKARAVLETLRNAGWLSEDDSRADYRKLIFFEATGVTLLQALRRIASPDATIFSDKVVNVCTTLNNRDALQEQPWSQVESSISNLQTGLAELKGMENSIKRYTRQQLAATTLKENLAVLFDQFTESIGRTCYAQLVHARLPSRLSDAKHAIDDVDRLGGAELQTKMQTEVMRREPALSHEAAMARVRLRLEELAELLHQIEPQAEAIDRRTAEFARRSAARFRYLQETTSENRSRVQNFFETLNAHFAGRRLAEIEGLGIEVPALLLHETRLLGGMESLYVPHLRREAGEIEPMQEPDFHDQDRVLAQLEGTLRDSLTVSRANRFVEQLPGERGERFDSQDLLREQIHNDEDIADLIACLLHARSSDAKFELEVPRHVLDADSGEFDSKLNYRIERFTLTKK